MYRIEERPGKGKVVVATADMPAGTLVFREEPLFTFNHISGSKYTNVHKTFHIEDFCEAFEQLPTEKKERYMNLFGPTNGPEIEPLRDALQSSLKMHEKVSFWLRAYSIFCYNAFGLGNGEQSAVYEIITRLSHSCAANCTRISDEQTMFCYTMVPVKCGDELTLSYNHARDLEPTHMRRFMYLLTKDFTCHCPRCDAEGDDTRQFNCFDRNCNGRHYVRQPLSQRPIPVPGRAYTGVEYVEPHLLPCTRCQRSPPSEYQTAMFALEERLSEEVDQIKQEGAIAGPRQLEVLIRRLQELPVPPWHSLCHTVAWARLDLEERYRQLGQTPSREQLRRSALQDIQTAATMQAILPFPDSRTQRFLQLAMPANLMFGNHTASLECGRRAVRMQALLFGRDQRSQSTDQLLAQALQWVQSTGLSPAAMRVPEGCCVFCGESPDYAAMKRSRCGACKQVIYCSKGCQKAHWPVHKRECKQA